MLSSASDRERQLPHRRQAFTLIELLVVVAIIALLAALLLPSLREAREKAKRVVCLNQMRQMTIATFLYADDSQGFLPGSHCAGTWSWGSGTSGTNATHLTTYNYAGVDEIFTRRYIANGDRKMMLCPSRYDRPTWSPTETYVGRKYWQYGYSSYCWAGSSWIPTCLISCWDLSYYWVRLDLQDGRYTLMTDCVSYEVAEAWEGGWPWMRQNNHYDPRRTDRVLASGGNALRADGGGGWIPNSGGRWTHTGQYAEHWPEGHIQAQADCGTAESIASTAYWFINTNHNTPSGPRRGTLVP